MILVVKEDGYKVIAIDGQEISPSSEVFIDDARGLYDR